MQISFAKFEFSALDHGSEASRLSAARAQFQAANTHFKTTFEKTERRHLLESWLEFEKENGDAEGIKDVQAKLPKAVKKRRQVHDEQTGAATGVWEEFFDYVFPEDGEDQSSLKLLQLAHQWKMQMAKGGNDDDDDEEEESDDEEEEEEDKDGNEESD